MNEYSNKALSNDITAHHPVKTMFDSIAARYDRANHWMSFNLDHRWRRIAISHVLPHTTIQAVDLCAGTLDFSIALLKAFPQSVINAVDFSERMLNYGLHKIPPQHRGVVTILNEDATQTSLPSGEANVVLCGYGMRNIPDQSAALIEISRLLQPGGQFITLDFFRPTTRTAQLFAAVVEKHLIPWMGGFITKEPEAYRYLHDSIANYHTLGSYRALLRAHGFEVSHSTHLAGGITSLIVARKPAL